MPAAADVQVRDSLRTGFEAGIPIAVATGLIGISFGVLARPVMGTVAPIVMSALVFAGSAQFAALAVLAAGGGAWAAIAAGMLMNARFGPMGIALAPSLEGSALRRALVGQTMVDATWALANRGGGRFDTDFMMAATLPTYVAWVVGTAVGVFAGELIGDPDALGLDAAFPAFFLALLFGEVRRGPLAVAAVVAAVAIALALTPVAPPGVPIIAACLAALLGLTTWAKRWDPSETEGGHA
ncbi:MAG TPA: AzlC family ABC transporter permease [Solirubrobacterales bacterium]|jgi:4-azaleucine resistance transporter AzlC